MATSKADQIRAFLKEFPGGTCVQFIETTGVTVASSHFSFVRNRMREDDGLPYESTQADDVRLFLRNHPDGTRAEFIAETGIEVAQSHFSVLKSDLRAKLTRRAQKVTSEIRGAVDGEERIKVLEEALAQEQRKNAYLLWLLEGERHGYLDRALKELTDDET